MGSQLFHRSSRRLVLTDAGEQFVPRARNVIAELAEAKEAILAQDAGPRGLLSVTAPTVFGIWDLPLVQQYHWMPSA